MWLILSLITAVSESLKNVFAKKATIKFSPITVTWAWISFSLVLLLPVLLIVGIPPLAQAFWLAFAIRIFLDLVSVILYTNSLKTSPLSLSLPMLAFTPGIILITSIFINHELPEVMGIAGLILIIIGSYLLNFDYLSKDLLFPFKQIVRNKGILMMFGVAVIWGFNASIHKYAMSLSNPWFYTAFGALILALILTPIAYFSSPKEFKSIFTRKNLSTLMPIGILDGVMVLPQMIATTMTYAAYVIAIKRLSIVFASLMGWYFFKENLQNRFIPIVLMVIGIFFITLS